MARKWSADVLVIDDDPIIRTLVMKYLANEERVSVSEASNGKSALKYAKKHIPDLILLDWRLPGIQGVDLLVELKSMKKTHEIPVVMLTRKSKVKDMERAFAHGAENFIAKPFSGLELKRKVLENLPNVIL
ncbi:PleD family two-component system response regulator [Kiloniella sp. EL199]|uniref:response regulator n=1 Tax=Kiloniella sp. EL199 TaxID=2107581 RepID=UPI000EA17A41|nr:response regulator [Kiloniella sp. EL199]